MRKLKRLLIIPAAGLGSRLQSTIPKVLYPVGGRPMLDYLFDLYSTVADAFLLVLHPASVEAVRRHCQERQVPIEYEIQMEPTGMLDAILLPWEKAHRHEPGQIWITWCDQIAVRPQTIRRLAETATRENDADMVLPTIIKQDPYIHLGRDGRGEIVELRQKREGDSMPEQGEGDIGLFSLSRRAYLELLPGFASTATATGALTRERNFLPFIPWLSARARVVTFPASEEIESIGINTPAELAVIEEYLRHGPAETIDRHSGI